MGNFNLINVENRLELGGLRLDPRTWFRTKKFTKDTVRILFVDDFLFPIVDNLEKAGYNVKRRRDIKDVDDADVKDRHIIFIDYDGVGKNFSEIHQGAALVKALKDTYGKKKFIVLYTDQVSIPSETSMSALFRAADSHMRKSDSDARDFIAKINEGLEVLKS